MSGFVHDKNSCLKMLRLSFPHKLNWESYIVPISKIEAFIRFMKFLYSQVAFYADKSTI